MVTGPRVLSPSLQVDPLTDYIKGKPPELLIFVKDLPHHIRRPLVT